MTASDEVGRLRSAISAWAAENRHPLVVAIDGHGAAGKSTLAARLASDLEVALVHVDDFWRMGSATASGPAREEPAMADYYDWERLRMEALLPLLQGRRATFVAVDPDTEKRTERNIAPASVIIVEGVSASCPSLADLVDHTVLVDTPEPARMQRLRAEIPEEAWNERWLDAERIYLASRPPEMFDLVLSGADAS